MLAWNGRRNPVAGGLNTIGPLSRNSGQLQVQLPVQAAQTTSDPSSNSGDGQPQAPTLCGLILPSSRRLFVLVGPQNFTSPFSEMRLSMALSRTASSAGSPTTKAPPFGLATATSDEAGKLKPSRLDWLLQVQ